MASSIKKPWLNQADAITLLCKISYSVNVYLSNLNGAECSLKLKVIWARISEKSQAVVFIPPTHDFYVPINPVRRKIPCFYSLKFKYEDSKQQSSSLILADLKLYNGSKSHLQGDAGQTH